MDTNELLADCWTAWADRLDALGQGDASRPTRCEGWTVHDLAAHAAPDVALLQALPGLVRDEPADVVDPVEMLRAFNAPGGAAFAMAEPNADAARAAARATPVTELAASFRGAAAFVRASLLADHTVVLHPLGGTVTIGVMRDIALLEAAVHLLDLIDAVGGSGPPPEAVHIARDLLARMADPVAFVDAAAGRRPCADVLPVLR